MKMKFIHRLMLALYALLGLCALAMAACRIFLPDFYGQITGEVWQLFEKLPFLPYVLVALLLIWSVGMFLLAFRRDSKKHDRSNVSIQNTEDGAVLVSVEAIETLVREAIGQSDEVLEVKSRVINHEDSITVTVRMVMSTNAHIPNITMLMQRNIKHYIEEFSGIAVREVIITVTEVREPAENRKALKGRKGSRTAALEAPADHVQTAAPAQIADIQPTAVSPAVPVTVEAPSAEATAAGPVYAQESEAQPAAEATAAEPESTYAQEPAAEPEPEAQPAAQEPATEAMTAEPEPSYAQEPAAEPEPEAQPAAETTAAEPEPVYAQEPATEPEPEAQPAAQEPATESEPETQPAAEAEPARSLESLLQLLSEEAGSVKTPKINLFLDPNDDPDYRPEQAPASPVPEAQEETAGPAELTTGGED